MSSREKELEIVEAATPGPWVWELPSEDDWPQSDQSLVTTWKGDDGQPETVIHAWGYDASGIEASPQDRAFIATFSPARVRELLDENYEVTRLLAERDLKLNYANKSIHRLESRLAAVERIADAIEEHDAPFEAFPTAQWVRKAARGE